MNNDMNHNLNNDMNHNLQTFWNPKDHVEEITKLPEFVKLYENFQDEPTAFFSDKRTQKRCRRIYRFLEWAYPFLQSDQDAEAMAVENDTSNRLRSFLEDSVSGSAVIRKSVVGESVVETVPTNSHHSTVKEAALKKTIKELEDRLNQIRRQLGDQ